ncbi:hypothetical protein LOTGIDRAFT_164331 [Lottia gigantea]|uniref:DUF19 domain-containing protein n=1 Tax=Lottia gigantea TaxID=225164 RepID=V4AAT3_LOTGI|nr:hypothetical protein LOTGIDRAFT_164331 [Lottia gigantea]ESO90401.1 hypothetical protein LOTGIDRAFT_164331 [Lottia gigantea]
MDFSSIYSILVTLVFCISAISAVCDEEKLALCKGPMKDASSLFYRRKRDASNQLPECGSFDEVEKCMNKDDLLKSCQGTEEWLNSRTVLDSYLYMCGEGKQDTIASIDCFENGHISVIVNMCSEKFFNGAGEGSPCSEASKIPKCVEELVSQKCNPAAGATMGRIIEHSTKALREYLSC